MKKLFLGMAALVLLFSSCSGSDDGGSASVTSHIMINGTLFTPDANTGMLQNIVTSFQAGSNSGAANTRVFALNNQGTSLSDSKSIEVIVTYPFSQASIDGTYLLDGGLSGNVNNYAGGSIFDSGAFLSFASGTVTVTDLGNNKFKLEFNNAVAENFLDETVTSTVTGYFQGTFVVGE
ncbi:MAG: hypothetical protein PSV16_06360 [Flavobacterium sp.]|nr:hypothetical protein [Flavobacterium sp.]